MEQKGFPDIQGVISRIEFPLRQDEVAVSKAISNLLAEGWEFGSLTKTHIALGRKWEVDLNPKGEIEQISCRIDR